MEEYPRTLINRRKWNERRDNIALDDIVLIVDTFLPRGQWPMGRVVKLYPDSVGVVRIVDVKSSTGVLKRPISKLCVIVKADRKEKPDDEFYLLKFLMMHLLMLPPLMPPQEKTWPGNSTKLWPFL